MDNPTNNTPVDSIDSKVVSKKVFKDKKLFIIVGIIFLIIASLLILFINKKQAPTSTSDITVKLKTEYQNPFDKSAKYTNPFENLK